ncbi:MAG: hypothetical protein IKS96_02725 [Fibrobacter sp.]|nr:hypothetical protein [Bacteroidaceae bacterium]MBR6448857.1 hypothetical protein [Fibrobacter sp.]
MPDWTEIISAALAALAGGGWLVTSHRRRQEKEEHATKLEAMQAKITASLRDSETKYTREALEIYTDNVVKPLRDELKTIRENQIRFQAAINLAPTCRIFPDCVVIRRLRQPTKDDDNHADGGQDLERHIDADTTSKI